MEFRQLRCLSCVAELRWPGGQAPPDQPAAAQPANPRPGARGSVADRGRGIQADRGGTGPARARPQRQRGGHLRRPGGAGGRRRHDQAAGRVSGRGCLGVGALAVRIFRERFPSVALDTVVGQAGAHLAALAARLDVAFVRLAGANGDSLAFRPLHREPVRGHPRAAPAGQAARRRAEHLANEPIVLFPRALDPPLHDHLVHDVLAGCGVAPSVVLEATTLESSLVAVAGGLGIAFAAESAAGQFTVRGVEFAPWSRWPRRCSSA